MEILAAIAGKLAEFTVEPIGRQVGYLAHYKSNHQKLHTKLGDLRFARDEVQYKVDRLERRGKRIETTVLNWKARVGVIITEAEEFMRDGRHVQTECLHGFCPHLVLRYQLSKKSTKLVEEIDELYGKKEFPNFAYDVPLQGPYLFSTGHYHAFYSRNLTVMRVMDELRNPDTEMILVWGIGGVGKTTLVEEVLRQAKDVNLFDDVVLVRDVKENPDLEKIQKEIAMKLGMSNDENLTLAHRAPLLVDRIKQKRTLVVLDDVWEKIDLLAVGVPRLATCKVVLTCRSRKELSLDRRTQTDISLDVLNEEEAWSLFQKMVGDVVRSVAIEVAKKCGGLPVLIVTVARALKDTNKLNAWKDTFRGGFDNKELTEKAYLALEWSYNQLEDKELKPLFLLCGIIVVENGIYLVDLLRYALGLGLIRNVDTIEEARDALNTQIEKLKDSCLLLDSDISMHVRMHDLVCEVAIRIASRDQHVLSVGYGGELKEWPDKDFFERCSKMSLKSSNIPMLSEVPWKCPKLEMLHLYREKYPPVEFPSNFFSEMEKLKVLGLTKVWMSLPQFLKNLQTLCLKECWLEEVALVGHLSNLEILSFARSDIKQLPKEIGQLIRLRWLDLSDCARLKVISPGVISRLERLEDLSLRNVFLEWEWEAGRGGSNASLLELKDLSQLTALEIYIENANILPSYLFSSKLVRYQIYIGNVWEQEYGRKKTMAETTLNTLKLKLAPSDELDHGINTLLKRSEDLSLDGTESVKSIARQLHVEDFQQLIHLHLQNNVDFTYIINRKVVFPNLTTLSIWNCDHLSFLFSFSMAQSLLELKHLKVSSCAIMEAIVSTRDQPNGENIDIVFHKLESLILKQLPNLDRFFTGSCTEFSPVTKFDTELGASIFDSTSSKKLDVENGTTVRACLFDAQVVFPNLTTLGIWNCDHLSFLFSFSMAQSLLELKHLKVSSCAIMEAIVSTRDQPNGENIDIVFHKLESLILKQLPNLDRFCTGSCTEFSPVTKFDTELGASIFDSTSSKKLDVENGTTVRACLFDAQVGFPKLKRLTIIGLPKLKTIWHTQLAPDSFCGLRDVTVQQCNSLEYIFPGSLIADVFNQQLQKLTVEECEVEEIISQGGGLEDQFVFPNLVCLEFRSLFQLKRFYPRMPAFSWPLLKTLVLLDCQKVDIFGAEFSGLQKTHDLRSLDRHAAKLLTPAKQSSILINENSFPKLEELTLVRMDIWYGRPISAVCCEKAVFAGIRNIHRDGSLPHLRTLRLHGMDMRLWENTKSAGQNFPQLEILEVKFCRLNNLELSSLSFQNLTILEVTFCWRLQYLTTYSVARGLRQLKKLKVDECKSMKQILASEGIGEDDSNCEIVFSKLQHLELSDLISLECFCSRNCTVKVPTLETVEVNWCSIKLKASSGILVVDSNMHLDVQKSHSSKEAFNTTESACSSENTQKQPVTNSSEEAENIEFNARELHDDSLTDEPNKHGPLLPGIAKREHAVEGVIQETSINSPNIEHHEVMGLNQKQIVTNTSKNLQETLIERLKEELRVKKADFKRLEEELRPKKADIIRLEEELRAKKADVTEERS